EVEAEEAEGLGREQPRQQRPRHVADALRRHHPRHQREDGPEEAAARHDAHPLGHHARQPPPEPASEPFLEPPLEAEAPLEPPREPLSHPSTLSGLYRRMEGALLNLRLSIDKPPRG